LRNPHGTGKHPLTIIKQYNLSLEMNTVTQQENVSLFPNIFQFLLHKNTEHIFSLAILSTASLTYQDRFPVSPL
jgi:sulfatase maturation enzyme AslB (radical SAM superfamily)